MDMNLIRKVAKEKGLDLNKFADFDKAMTIACTRGGETPERSVSAKPVRHGSLTAELAAMAKDWEYMRIPSGTEEKRKYMQLHYPITFGLFPSA